MTVEPGYLVMGAVSAAVWAGFTVLFAGLQRIPWRHAAVIGLGVALVAMAGAIATSGLLRQDSLGALVLLGAIGGGLAVRGYERGKTQRDATIEAIVRPR